MRRGDVTRGDGFLTQRWVDLIFVGQAVIIIVAVLAMLTYLWWDDRQAEQRAERQLVVTRAVVRCSLEETADAIEELGRYNGDIRDDLGLPERPPVSVLRPDVTGFNCEELLGLPIMETP